MYVKGLVEFMDCLRLPGLKAGFTSQGGLSLLFKCIALEDGVMVQDLSTRFCFIQPHLPERQRESCLGNASQPILASQWGVLSPTCRGQPPFQTQRIMVDLGVCFHQL